MSNAFEDFGFSTSSEQDCVDENRLDRSDAVNPPNPLLQCHWVPWKIEVDHAPRDLEIDTNSARGGRHKCPLGGNGRPKPLDGRRTQLEWHVSGQTKDFHA